MARALPAVIALLALLATLLLAAPVGAAAGDLESALLTADDLPADLAPSGATHEPPFDIDEASFQAAGGIDRVQQTWQAAAVDPTSRVVVVFDFRMLFPTAEDAHAYLESAEPILSESFTGLVLQPDTPVLGEESRHYAGSRSQGGLTIENQNFLFRVGPMVAKVFVAGFDTTLDDALPIALAAGARTETWLLGGNGGAPPPSAPPPSAPATQAPRPSAAPIASEPPVASGTQLRQWAQTAVASSEYGSDAWGAIQVTGEPDVDSYSDDVAAWAPESSDGTQEWIELGYAVPVIPVSVGIVESLGNGAVVRVEALDPATGEWVELWSGTDPTPGDDIWTFLPRLERVTFATDRIRVSLDTDLGEPGWNEIDAVELVGIVP